MWATLWQDIRYGLRTLRRAPGFTTVAVLSFAVGIGLNSAIFTIADNLRFLPLPCERPASADLLVALRTLSLSDTHSHHRGVVAGLARAAEGRDGFFDLGQHTVGR